MSKDNVHDETPLKVQEKNKLRVQQSLPALAVIGIGVVLLAVNIFHFDLIEFLWPGFVIAPGLVLMWPAYSSTPERQSRLSFLTVPGAIIVTTGLLLFAMNMADHFEAWAYSWTLVFASVAGALMYIKRFDSTSNVHESGYKFVRTMIILFMGLAVFFEVIIFESFSPLLPLVVIGIGVYMLIKNRREAAIL
ncbi:MAG: hypothetical protein GY943_24145 [Chloroflexi bacterium]|nr:hypothetical protein [Chloroflexota bacterium]